ncbi:MAG: ATP-binding protein, partial [Calditrichia bacterium]
FDVNELQGMKINEIFFNDEESEKCLRTLLIPGKRMDEKEIKFRQKNGKSLIVGLSSSPIHDENNQFDGIVLLFRDLTEVRHLKHQIERMERLALLGELSAGIAHEVRNPLAGIKVAAQVLEESYGGSEFQLQMVERIVREVDKANRLLKEFFKFARPTKPKLAFHDVEMIIDGVYLLLAPKLKKRNIQFVTEFGDDVPQAFVDETQLEQIILNLFLNAADAMPEGGNLKVSTMRRKLKLLDDERERMKSGNDDFSYVIIKISDNGKGIPAETQPKVFNPFFTTKTDGLGLGLSICSRLIEENSGKIDFASQQGKGTTFVLALPAFTHN